MCIRDRRRGPLVLFGFSAEAPGVNLHFCVRRTTAITGGELVQVRRVKGEEVMALSHHGVRVRSGPLARVLVTYPSWKIVNQVAHDGTGPSVRSPWPLRKQRNIYWRKRRELWSVCLKAEGLVETHCCVTHTNGQDSSYKQVWN